MKRVLKKTITIPWAPRQDTAIGSNAPSTLMFENETSDLLILWILHADECKQRQLAWGDRTRWTDSRNTRVTDFHFGVHCTARAQENDWLVFFYIDWVIKYINKAQNSLCILENQKKNRKVQPSKIINLAAHACLDLRLIGAYLPLLASCASWSVFVWTY